MLILNTYTEKFWLLYVVAVTWRRGRLTETWQWWAHHSSNKLAPTSNQPQISRRSADYCQCESSPVEHRPHFDTSVHVRPCDSSPYTSVIHILSLFAPETVRGYSSYVRAFTNRPQWDHAATIIQLKWFANIVVFGWMMMTQSLLTWPYNITTLTHWASWIMPWSL